MSHRAAASGVRTPTQTPTLAEQAIAATVAAGALFIPLVVSRAGADTFRVAKELAFRAEAIVLLVALVFWLTARKRSWKPNWRRADFALAAAVLAWTLVTVLASTKRPLSADAYVTIAAAVVIYFGATLAANAPWSIVIIDFGVVAGCINSVVVALQETQVWNPFQFAPELKGEHLTSTAFIGHPNDVGTYLLTPLLAALVMVFVSRGARRWIYVGATVVLVVGMAASSTRTAIGAFIAGAIVFAITRSWRAIVIVAAALVVVVISAINPSTTLGKTTRIFWKGIRERRYDMVFSMRLPLFLSAIDMIRDHPLTGVGPGCFAFHDMPYRMQLRTHYPEPWTRGWPQNAGQTHNDHLQVAAETGLPGYALLIAALVIGVRAPHRLRGSAEPLGLERRFARELLPPLMLAVLVVMFGQFPLELAAPRVMMVTFAGLCAGWISR